MRITSRLILFVAIALCPLQFETAWAQTHRAQLSGSVTDQSGAAIPGAAVRAENIETGVSQTAETNAMGIYRLPNLQPGRYSIEVEQDGFKRFVRRGIVLQVADHLTLDVALELGEVTTEITVAAETPLLETASADVSQLVDQRRMQELPLIARDVMKLAVLSPGFTAGARFNDPTVNPNSSIRISTTHRSTSGAAGP